MANLFNPSSYGLYLVPLFLLAYVSANSSAARLFACASFLILRLLHICICLYEAAPHGSPRRGIIRAAVWSLSTLLTAMFSYCIAETLPLPVAVVVWCAGAATVTFGFYLLFVYNNCKNDGAADATAAEKPAAID
ncbi:uncharacterized protein LOC109719547 [Ananas comosus]|uniref:Uncharacterized protein LOC109719547 n=1 Tax=Ananas comosus TaxID=4615 RepID=A0A199V325_ANACO|nr:uncharacterized protein LOC109719547 [Ananas comosus]OAY71454.1 hypothetical protein ACMD2_24785 [Ananas comosus]